MFRDFTALIAAGAVGLGTLLVPAVSSAEEWTLWRGTTDSLLEWRWRRSSFGKNMSGVCEVQIRAREDGEFNFRFEVTYQPEGLGDTSGGRRPGQAQGVRRDGRYGGDTIGGCRGVSAVKVSSLSHGTLRAAPSRPASPASRTSSSRPSITGIAFEPHCIELLKQESEQLQLAGATKTLLAWSPLLRMAGERVPEAAFHVAESHWEELARAIAGVDKFVLYRLATAARIHANSGHHFGNPKAKAFWNAMADFYGAQANQ